MTLLRNPPPGPPIGLSARRHPIGQCTEESICTVDDQSIAQLLALGAPPGRSMYCEEVVQRFAGKWINPPLIQGVRGESAEPQIHVAVPHAASDPHPAQWPSCCLKYMVEGIENVLVKPSGCGVDGGDEGFRILDGAVQLEYWHRFAESPPT